MIPPPKLDDRTFNDIVEEAIRMIPRYAPEWTNHNPSDPGITLLELAAWMTDLIIYRLNQVPDKNYVAFLNLLGIKLRPPRSARGLVQFTLVEQAQAAAFPKERTESFHGPDQGDGRTTRPTPPLRGSATAVIVPSGRRAIAWTRPSLACGSRSVARSSTRCPSFSSAPIQAASKRPPSYSILSGKSC